MGTGQPGPSQCKAAGTVAAQPASGHIHRNLAFYPCSLRLALRVQFEPQGDPGGPPGITEDFKPVQSALKTPGQQQKTSRLEASGPQGWFAECMEGFLILTSRLMFCNILPPRTVEEMGTGAVSESDLESSMVMDFSQFLPRSFSQPVSCTSLQGTLHSQP